MKYCKKCGMLLEDSIEQCIKCGTDVSIPANVSLYPPEVEAKMQEKKAEDKNKTALVAILIVVFVVLALLVGVMVWKASSGDLRSRESVKATAEVQEEPAEAFEEPESEPLVEEKPASNREVKDENGSYYICVPEMDEAGNHIFNMVYPEDINQLDFQVTNRYSSRFSISMSAVANNEDNSVRFTYMSPQQLWQQKSEKGHSSRNNDYIPDYCMSFYEFVDAKSYIEAVIKQCYPKAKKVELISQNKVSDSLTEAVETLSKQRQDYFLKEKIGDYANLGEDAEYATTGSSCSAEIFEYQITDPSKEVMYCRYYVPVISNDLMYSTEIGADMGTITEWYPLCVCSFEAGNDFDYEDYVPAFELFCANAVPTRLFMYLNHCAELDIEKAIKAGEAPEFADTNRLKEYASKYKADSDIGDVGEAIYSFLSVYGSKVFTSDDMTIRTGDDIAVVFFDKENDKLFVSPDETEYPGDTYEELKLAK